MLNPLFIINVILLLLNDGVWKYQFHNYLTGKLSDFTGLYAFTIFLIGISSFSRKKIVVFTALFFCWWKSPLSDPVVFLLNEYAGITVSRVVDYYDLLALIILPFVFIVKPVCFSKEKINCWAIRLSAIISFFAFCATSLPYRELYYYPSRVNEVSFKEDFYSSLNTVGVLKRLDAEKTGYIKDSVRYYRVSENLDLYYRLKNQYDNSTQWVPISNKMDSALFVKKTNQKFFTLPLYILNGDSLFNIELEIYPSGGKKKSTIIKIESFQTKNPQLYNDFFYGRLRKLYKKHFKDVFRN